MHHTTPEDCVGCAVPACARKVSVTFSSIKIRTIVHLDFPLMRCCLLVCLFSSRCGTQRRVWVVMVGSPSTVLVWYSCHSRCGCRRQCPHAHSGIDMNLTRMETSGSSCSSCANSCSTAFMRQIRNSLCRLGNSSLSPPFCNRLQACIVSFLCVGDWKRL